MASYLLLSFLLQVSFFSLAWFAAQKVNNYSWVDAVWSYSFLLQALLAFSMAETAVLRHFLFLAVVAAWSLRLGTFLAFRIYSHHPKEDTRYLTLRQRYGADLKKRFYWFYQFQAVSVVLLAAPYYEVFAATSPTVSFLEWAGLAIAVIGLIGEHFSDRQMAQFKSRSENKGQVCNVGLWRLSRHPNYFFESVIWWGLFVFIFAASGAFYALFAPALILYLLLCVTGVPPSEAQSLLSRGEKYRDYQKKTSKFVPWWPRE